MNDTTAFVRMGCRQADGATIEQADDWITEAQADAIRAKVRAEYSGGVMTVTASIFDYLP